MFRRRLCFLCAVDGGGSNGETVVVTSLAGLVESEVHLAQGEVDLIVVFLVFLVVEEVLELFLKPPDIGMLEVGT